MHRTDQSRPFELVISADSSSRAMALTISAAGPSHQTSSKPIPISRRRPSRYEVTTELIREIADANDSPTEHSFADDSYVLDKEYGLLSDSTSGAYVMKRRETGLPVGVFKPRDEELSNVPEAPKLGVVVGDAAVKEHAAYVLDHGSRAGVPRTETVILMEHNLDFSLESSPSSSSSLGGRDAATLMSPSRLGSFQEFREHLCTSEDLGSSLFPVEDVQLIGLLDLRLFNLDRHLGNILVQALPDGKYSLVPIDHGYILPSFRCLSDAWFCWTSWRQSEAPFSDSIKQYISDMNPFSDIARLKRIGLRDECILTYVLCTVFVKECVDHDWTLHGMALSMQRDLRRMEDFSDFEYLVSTASARAGFDSFEFKDAESWGSGMMLAFLDEFEELVQAYVVDPVSLYQQSTQPLHENID